MLSQYFSEEIVFFDTECDLSDDPQHPNTNLQEGRCGMGGGSTIISTCYLRTHYTIDSMEV